MDTFTVSLNELDRSSLAVAGGKGANLGELLRAGFAVPDGFCITTAAYRRFVASAGLAPRVAELLRPLDHEDPAQVAAVGAGIREAFNRASVPQEIKAAILEAARPLEGAPLAVRSSATAEDLPEASFAGQQDTYLNVVGEEALVGAVRRCWASLWTDRAIAYRQRNDIPHEGVALAVIVQRTIAADTAGVLFTANPVSGKRTEVVIDASIGLGEAVVSGLVSPDNYVVDKRNLAFVVKRIGVKELRVVSTPGGGTAKAAVDAATREVQALPDHAIRALAHIGSRIEEHYGWPQDVEWASADGKLYVLQSRPITSLYPAPPPSRDGRLHVWVSVNSLEGMLEPFTPLGASMFARAAMEAFVGGDPERAFIRPLGGRLYADVTPLLGNPLGRRLPSAVLPEVEPVIGRILQQLIDEGRLGPAQGSPRGTLLRLLRRYWRTILPLVARVLRNVASARAARRRLDDVIVPRLAAMRAEIAKPRPPDEQARLVIRMWRQGWAPALVPNLIPLVAAGIACYKRAEVLVHENGLDEKLLAATRQGLPFNKTTTMDLDLWALAERFKADEVAREAVQTRGPDDLAAAYLASALPATVQSGMAEFLAVYGHRGVREIDIGLPRWAEDPAYLFGILQNYLALADPEAAPDEHFARQAHAADRAVDELVAQARRLPRGRLKAAMLGFFLRRYRQLGGLRESPKFYIVWMFQSIRHGMLEAGKRLVEAGRLERPEDVFFLTVDELEQVGGAQSSLQSLVARRRREYERELKRHRLPRVLTSEGEALYGEALAPDAGTLVGTGASPGVARGRARVIRDPHDAKLEPGEILVAPSTDPAWTPLFLTAGGLVMEAGGLMSHGSIVAREYGIPAVVGVAEATTHIATGQALEVDGYQGLVRIAADDNG